MKIEKKILKQYFDKILSGDKTYEVRLADFDCRPGDTLVLREWDSEKKIYTGREIEKKVTYVLKTKEIDFWPTGDVEKYGYQVIAFK